MTAWEGLRRCIVSDTSTGNGKVVMNRSMSLDGFVAGPGDAMNWIFDFMRPIEDEFPEIMAATGAMLVGRRTYEVGKRMAENPDIARRACNPSWRRGSRSRTRAFSSLSNT